MVIKNFNLLFIGAGAGVGAGEKETRSRRKRNPEPVKNGPALLHSLLECLVQELSVWIVVGQSPAPPWLSPRMPCAGLTCLNCGGSESSSSLSISQNALCKISFTCRSSPLSGLCIERKKQWDLVGIEHDVRTSVPLFRNIFILGIRARHRYQIKLPAGYRIKKKNGCLAEYAAAAATVTFF